MIGVHAEGDDAPVAVDAPYPHKRRPLGRCHGFISTLAGMPAKVKHDRSKAFKARLQEQLAALDRALKEFS